MSRDDHVERAVAAIARGGMAVVVDAPDREHEGDLVMSAAHVRPEDVNFMATEGRGLICVAMRRERLDALGIAPMAAANSDPRGTAFHVSVDHSERTTTGISASDRAATIRALAAPRSTRRDFTQPGHVFPLAAREGGVLTRAGHTEASLDLCRLAGEGDTAVICEIARPDGEMARYPELVAFARRHGLPIVTIDDLAAHRRATEPLVERVTEARIPTAWGEFTAVGYRDLHEEHEHVAFVLGDVAAATYVPVHVHPECLAGDVFASGRCGCGPALDEALTHISAVGTGVVVYVRDDRGARLELYGAANCALGAADRRSLVAEQIIDDLVPSGAGTAIARPAAAAA